MVVLQVGVAMVVLHALASTAAFQLVPSTQAVQVLSVSSAVAWASKPSPTGQVAVSVSQVFMLAVAYLPEAQAWQVTSVDASPLRPWPAVPQVGVAWSAQAPLPSVLNLPAAQAVQAASAE